ncbi:BZ3500_MvSof-1268-A1-R1_Chr5-2g08130 [Microbotryum saponariae]|uniref:BZ3500_MvSof-1268-A1-R1_Chr5-2g08130 protein n=1 Tax=Microbotryum saponariae TaxID=289078 RepID=A0A2X0LJF5_9BASI|nr:BZ3500_MvSof-1268-A1-R1_Chr5-2g08130 [Microbotryum saponariae]SDA05999.1 BZ3501_MvSof-1269-A2-R1_Chr5-2g07952 [Microbotryum saponariae]
MSSKFISSLTARRTVYALSASSPVPNSKIVEIVNEIVKHSPTAFNSQSSRAVVVFGDEHKKVWQFTKKALKAIVPAEAWPQSEQRVSGFENAHGTVLLYEDKNVVKGLQEKMPMYADKFPLWADHAHGILASNLWVALELEGLGANLQHYNPLLDADVQKEFDIPEGWELKAQLVFGKVEAPAGEKTFQPLESRVKVFGA